MSRPLVSVITPTWHRPDLLIETVENVLAQDYPNVQHVIVSDGPDVELETALYPKLVDSFDRLTQDGRASIVFGSLGFNTTSFLPDSRNICPLMVGALLAQGEYQMWLSDDERMTPDHISNLVEALEEDQADFAYSRVSMHWADGSGDPFVIGTDRPTYGQITNCLYKRDLLKLYMPLPYTGDQAMDWHVISRWVELGAAWAYVPKVTLTHRIG